MTEEENKELARLLRKPEGEEGMKVADMLNETNKHITSTTYKTIPLHKGDVVLEIGFGNGKLMTEILEKESGVRVHGIDFSKDMVSQAINNLRSYIEDGVLDLKEGSVERIAFSDETFDTVYTINTLYFWPSPELNCKEVFRVIKSGGKLAIGIRPEEEAASMPFTKYGFQLYDKDAAIELLKNAGFKNVEVKVSQDPPVKINNELRKLTTWVVYGEKP